MSWQNRPSNALHIIDRASNAQYGLMCGIVEKWMRDSRGWESDYAKGVRQDVFGRLNLRQPTSSQARDFLDKYIGRDEDNRYILNQEGQNFIGLTLKTIQEEAGQTDWVKDLEL